MELISKREMLKLNTWRTFERYPLQGSSIVLHVQGYRIRENKNIHDFISIYKFNPKTFNPRKYIPKQEGTVWTYSWQPMKNLTVKKQ